MNNLNLKLFKIKEEANTCSNNFKNLRSEISEIVNTNNNNYKSIKSDVNRLEEKLGNIEIKSNLTTLDSKFLVYNKDENLKINSDLINVHNKEGYEELLNLEISSKMFEQKIRGIKDIKSEKNNSELKMHFNKFKDEVNNMFFDINQEIMELLEESNKLTKENQILKSKFEEKNKALLVTLKCNRCNLNYLVKNNTDTSCIYHPGKINYFSCKGCGQDEYYTCCTRCSKCSNGCKYSKHVTEII